MNNDILKIWLSEQHTCKKCGKIMTEYFGSGKFCSRSCANGRKHTEEEKLKISKAVKLSNAKKYKPKKCKICGVYECTNNFCTYSHRLAQIKTLIKYFGFREDCLGSHDVFEEWNRVRNVLYKLYWIDNKSSTEIAKIFNYPSPCNLPGKVFVYLDIPKKTHSQATSENYLYYRLYTTNTNSKYITEWHDTWFGQKVFLRSSYESNFASTLDSKKIYYEVESLRIEYYDTQMQKQRIAIPDFYIPHVNTIVEIKSSWTLDKQNMIDKRNAYLKNNYNFKLILDNKEVDLDNLL